MPSTQHSKTRIVGGDDRGFSLVEVMMAMSIMTFVTVVIVGAVTQIYSGTKRVDNVSQARDQLDTSFSRLDKELRYASWVARPGKGASGNWYVEFATLDGCRQLKLTTDGRLFLTLWAPGATTTDTPMALASGVRVITGTDPFTLLKAGEMPYASASPGAGMGSEYRLVFHQVRLNFDVVAGTITLPFDAIFTAQNTELSTPTTDQCATIPGGRT
jgi:prepilin-type N-terminal cleavage/methylation domain-containing protein